MCTKVHEYRKTCVFLLVRKCVFVRISTKRATDGVNKMSRFHNSFGREDITGCDLHRLPLSLGYVCLECVCRHQIVSLVFYRSGFIVNGCRFTCQTTCSFRLCNLLAFTSPTRLPAVQPETKLSREQDLM